MNDQQPWRPTYQTVGVLMALVAAACFGTLAIFGKVAEDVGLDTTTLLTYRFLIGTVLIWLGLALWGRLRILEKRERRVAFALGLLYAIFTGLYFWGLLFIPAGLTSLVFYTYPVYVYVLAVWLLDERLSRYKFGALGLALGGVVLIVGGDVDAVDTFGVMLVMLAALGLAGYVVGSRAALGRIAPDILAGTAMGATTAAFLVFGVGSGRLTAPTGTEQWLVVAGIASLGTAFPIFLYITALNRIQASHASVLGTAEPLVTVVLGIVLLGESLTPLLVVGGALILTGVVIIQIDVGAKRKAA